MDDATPLSPDELRGFAVIAEACAEAFLNEPSAQIVDDVARVAQALGDGRFDGVVADEALRQRYSERFFVPTSPLYVPLSECSVRGAAEVEGRVRYAPASGAQTDHVLKCYRAVGFDYRALAGFGPAVGSLHPDSLAAELAFMAFLARAAVEAAGEDPAASERAAELLCQFAREHARRGCRRPRPPAGGRRRRPLRPRRRPGRRCGWVDRRVGLPFAKGSLPAARRVMAGRRQGRGLSPRCRCGHCARAP